MKGAAPPAPPPLPPPPLPPDLLLPLLLPTLREKDDDLVILRPSARICSASVADDGIVLGEGEEELKASPALVVVVVMTCLPPCDSSAVDIRHSTFSPQLIVGLA
jgi:hypothetical protein